MYYLQWNADKKFLCINMYWVVAYKICAHFLMKEKTVVANRQIGLFKALLINKQP